MLCQKLFEGIDPDPRESPDERKRRQEQSGQTFKELEQYMEALIERLRREPNLVISLVEELLRYEPPVQILPNCVALADITIAGTTILKGSPVILLLASGNRDPARFHDPDKLDPDRRENMHFGFGSGIHYCYGAPLARLETQTALTELIRRLENPILVHDPSPYRQSATLRGPRHLIVGIDVKD